jgi:hypothetical protein
MSPEWTPIIVAAIGGVFSVLGVVVTVLLNKYVKDAQMRDVLETALQNGLGVLQQAAKDGVQLKVDPKVEAQLPAGTSAPMTNAVQYVLDHGGEAVERFDVSATMIAQKIVARAGVQEMQTGIPVDSNALPGQEIHALMSIRRH